MTSVNILLFCLFFLPQNDEVERELFTFDKFYELYHKICPRTDVEQLFSEMWVINRIYVATSNSLKESINKLCRTEKHQVCNNLHAPTVIVFV